MQSLQKRKRNAIEKRFAMKVLVEAKSRRSFNRDIPEEIPTVDPPELFGGELFLGRARRRYECFSTPGNESFFDLISDS